MKILLHALAFSLITLLTIVNPVHAARLQATRSRTSLTRLCPTNLGSLTRFCHQAKNTLHAKNTRPFSSLAPKLPASTKEYVQELKEKKDKTVANALSSMGNENQNPHIKKYVEAQMNNFRTLIADHQERLRTPVCPLMVHPTLPTVIENAKKYACDKKNIEPQNIFVTVERIDGHSTIPAQVDSFYDLIGYHESFGTRHYPIIFSAQLSSARPPYTITLDSRLIPYFQKYPSAIKALMLMKVTDMYEGHCLTIDALPGNVDPNAKKELHVRQARIANLLPALDNEKDATAIHAYFAYYYPEIKNLMKNNATDKKDELLNFDFDFMHQNPYMTAEKAWRIKKMHKYNDLSQTKLEERL